MSTRAGTDVGRWAPGRPVLRAADPRMAALVDADPGLDSAFAGWPSDLWGALVAQVISQQLSRAAAAAILRRLKALHGGRLPTPAELLDDDAQTLRGLGLSHAKAGYLHDLGARLVDDRLDLERLRALDDDDARAELIQIKGVGRFTADGVLMLALRPTDVWPAADLALRRAVGRVWQLDATPSFARVDAIGKRFRPWRTLAALYLYRSSSPWQERPHRRAGGCATQRASRADRADLASGRHESRLGVGMRGVVGFDLALERPAMPAGVMVDERFARDPLAEHERLSAVTAGAGPP